MIMITSWQRGSCSSCSGNGVFCHTVRRAPKTLAALRVPSTGECRFCNITREDYPEIMEDEEDTEPDTANF